MLAILQQVGKVKGKTRKNSGYFGDLLEFSSKCHQDLMEIVEKNWNYVKKSLISSKKNIERQQNMVVKMMETKIEMMEKKI